MSKHLCIPALLNTDEEISKYAKVNQDDILNFWQADQNTVVEMRK